MGIARVFLHVCFVLIISERIHGVPFLYNSGKSFLTSIFSSAPNNPDSNIEDLRTPKMERSNLMAENTEELDDMNFNDDPPAQPHPITGLVQKKIGKLLTKLQLFSILTGGLGQMQPEDQPSLESEFEDTDNAIDKNNLILLLGNMSESNVYKINNPPSYLPPINADNRITLYPAEIRKADMEEITENPDGEDNGGNKISLTPGLGVYFMELIGGLATLIYGAALQISNAATGNSTPPSNAI